MINKKEIPNITFKLANNIKIELEKKGWHFLSNKDIIFLLELNECEYSFDSIKSIERNFSKKGWVLKMINYFRGDEKFSYTFKMAYNGTK